MGEGLPLITRTFQGRYSQGRVQEHRMFRGAG